MDFYFISNSLLITLINLYFNTLDITCNLQHLSDDYKNFDDFEKIINVYDFF